MEPKKITKSLKRIGGVKAVANKIGVACPTVSQVIHRVRNTPRIQQAIASAIDLPVEEVFPETKDAA